MLKCNPSARTRKAKSDLANASQHGTVDDVAKARYEFRASAAEDYIHELLATAPPLSVETREHLATLLAPGGE